MNIVFKLLKSNPAWWKGRYTEEALNHQLLHIRKGLEENIPRIRVRRMERINYIKTRWSNYQGVCSWVEEPSQSSNFLYHLAKVAKKFPDYSSTCVTSIERCPNSTTSYIKKGFKKGKAIAGIRLSPSTGLFEDINKNHNQDRPNSLIDGSLLLEENNAGVHIYTPHIQAAEDLLRAASEAVDDRLDANSSCSSQAIPAYPGFDSEDEELESSAYSSSDEYMVSSFSQIAPDRPSCHFAASFRRRIDGLHRDYKWRPTPKDVTENL
ncbi:hypothetical protein OCU04_000673 [Sclerotinia nivalis]|uniref:Uncharacterized protein n=1 Tax=Sclerotinia nivalis TaxID=352851 RepID=A0A9X0DNM8_9HELO|nr:hypothetical protein OCU04_000673 [Sclerotinia nivalis]